MTSFRFRLPRGTHSGGSSALLPWFDQHRRSLPWRENRTPYRVWISEIMLQQTRVDTVIPYFERWMRTFPTVQALAEADLEPVLKLWEGLGYYSRARSLHRAAREVVTRFDGELPSDPDLLASLPGIGPYTCAAILSLAFDRPFAVLDGNVERVLTRLCGIEEDVRTPAVKSALRELAGRMMGSHPPGPFNEAMMELGATVCLPRNPRCGDCPLHQICRGRTSGRPEAFPVKAGRKPIPTVEVGAAITWRDADTFLIARRKEKGLLGGMWEFPGGKREPGEEMQACIRRELREELDVGVIVGDRLIRVHHTYSHFHLRMDVHHCTWEGDPPRAVDCADFRWVTLEECGDLPFGKADHHVLDALRKRKGV